MWRFSQLLGRRESKVIHTAFVVDGKIEEESGLLFNYMLLLLPCMHAQVIVTQINIVAFHVLILTFLCHLCLFPVCTIFPYKKTCFWPFVIGVNFDFNFKKSSIILVFTPTI